MKTMGTQLGLWMAVLGSASAGPAPAQAMECADLWQWLNTALPETRRHLRQWQQRAAGVGLCLALRHGRGRRRSAPRKTRYAWGGGLVAHRRAAENGDTDIVYFLVFSDSHSKPSSTWAMPGRRTGDRASIRSRAWASLPAIIQRPGHLANGLPFPGRSCRSFIAALREGHADVSTFIPDAERRHQPRQRAVFLRA